MRTVTPVETVESPSPLLGSLRWWIVAGLWFGVGDLATTSIGLGLAGVAELHPVAASVSQRSGLGAMVALKLVVFGCCYLLWRRAPRPHRVGVPLGLAAVGLLVTAWNVHILLRATLP